MISGMNAARAGLWAVGIAVLAFGCGSEPTGFGPPPSCPPENPLCKGTPGSGSVPGGEGGGGSGGGAAGGQEETSAEGTVRAIVDEAFQVSTPYTGVATIYGLSPNGSTVSAPYGGATGSSFTLDGVTTGTSWLLVEDNTGGAGGILSTYSPHFLPDPSPLVLPVIERSVLQNIALGQGLPLPALTGAQVVLEIERADAPLAGVTVEGVMDGTLLYDTGAGTYSDVTNQTGIAGTIVMLDLGGTGERTFTLTDANAESFAIKIPIAPGAATFATVEL